MVIEIDGSLAVGKPIVDVENAFNRAGLISGKTQLVASPNHTSKASFAAAGSLGTSQPKKIVAATASGNCDATEPTGVGRPNPDRGESPLAPFADQELPGPLTNSTYRCLVDIFAMTDKWRAHGQAA